MQRHFSTEWFLIVGLTILALVVRLYQLAELPPGLHYDEAANGVDALDILSGRFSIFFERNNGREPLFIYLQAISIALLGATPFALRATSAVVGALTVPAIYWMVKEAFIGTEFKAHWLALWTALFVTFSYWHLNFSRIGYRAILLPLLASVAFAWFWRAWRKMENTRSLPWRDLIFCGVFVGGCLYTYIAGRFVPVLIVIVAIAGALTRQSSAQFKKIVLGILIIGFSALLVFAPLGFYFLMHPESFLGRAADVSVFNPKYNQGNPMLAITTSAIETAKMFAITGDPNWRHNPAGRPVMDFFLASWMAGGLLLAIVRWKSLPHLFVLTWFIVLSFPVILTASGLPHTLRALGLIPAVYLLSVLTMLSVGERLKGLVRQFAVWLPLPFLLFSAMTDWQDYFSAWRDNNPSNSFQVYFTELAHTMSLHGQSDTVWILPLHPAFSIFMPYPSNYPVEFLYVGAAKYGLIVSDSSAPNQLQNLTKGCNKAHLIRWKNELLQPEGIYFYGDPKRLLNFLLSKYGRAIEENDGGRMIYTTYELFHGIDYHIATTFTSLDTSFGGKVRLTGVAYGRTATQNNEFPAALEEKKVPSGHNAWVVLRWQAQTPIDFDLKTTLYLTDEDGHLVGQSDDLLVGDRYPFYRVWEQNEAAGTYHILPILPAVPPGLYNLYLGVYEDKTLQRYPVLDTHGQPRSTALLLGSVEITRPLDSPKVAPVHSLPNAPLLAPSIALLGYDLPGNTFSPGDKLPLTLYWQAKAAPLGDYSVTVELRDSADHVIAQRNARPAYPATQWQTGDVWRDWHDLEIPVTVPSGDYRLVVSLYDGDKSAGRVELANVQVQGRPHQFTPPSIQYPMRFQVGSQIAFLGYDLKTRTVSPGGTVSLTLYWQALARMDRSYTVFTHLLGPDDHLYGQQDNLPEQGTSPTTSWLPGEYITDRYDIQIKPDALPGEYRLRIGMYDATTGTRLAISANGQPQGDYIILETPIRVIR